VRKALAATAALLFLFAPVVQAQQCTPLTPYVTLDRPIIVLKCPQAVNVSVQVLTANATILDVGHKTMYNGDYMLVNVQVPPDTILIILKINTVDETLVIEVPAYTQITIEEIRLAAGEAAANLTTLIANLTATLQAVTARLDSLNTTLIQLSQINLKLDKTNETLTAILDAVQQTLNATLQALENTQQARENVATAKNAATAAAIAAIAVLAITLVLLYEARRKVTILTT